MKRPKEKEEAINAVHEYDKRIKRHLEKLKDKSYNSKKIIEFHNFLISECFKSATQEKYLDKLPKISD